MVSTEAFCPQVGPSSGGCQSKLKETSLSEVWAEASEGSIVQSIVVGARLDAVEAKYISATRTSFDMVWQDPDAGLRCCFAKSLGDRNE